MNGGMVLGLISFFMAACLGTMGWQQATPAVGILLGGAWLVIGIWAFWEGIKRL